MNDRQTVACIERIHEENPEAMQMDGLDDAIIGIAEIPGGEPLLAYSETRIITILFTKQKMTMEEAREYYDFNIAGCYVGKGTPVIIRDCHLGVSL